jgi:hypothetical protein
MVEELDISGSSTEAAMIETVGVAGTLEGAV